MSSERSDGDILPRVKDMRKAINAAFPDNAWQRAVLTRIWEHVERVEAVAVEVEDMWP